jgi:hypothetical protein
MSAKFFCENCGAEVGRSAGKCPKCGRVFDSVLCPQCGYGGKETEFKNGCPACGYCAPADGSAGFKPVGKEHLRLMQRLPVWLYALAAIVLGAVIIALVTALR